MINILDSNIDIFNRLFETINEIFDNFGILVDDIVCDHAINLIELTGYRLCAKFAHNYFALMHVIFDAFQCSTNKR